MEPDRNLINDIEHLKNWDAGRIISPESIDLFGEEGVFVAVDIDERLYDRIHEKSYKKDCDVPIKDLCYLKLLHYDLNQEIHIGELICNKSISVELIEIFKELYKHRYPIQKMLLIDYYNGDDNASMLDNNTSAFNFRLIAGSNKLSKHSTGCAIDINPLYNPYVKECDEETYVLPTDARSYVNRNHDFPYKIEATDICCQLFKKYGFIWGGDWETVKDYQHFEK